MPVHGVVRLHIGHGRKSPIRDVGEEIGGKLGVQRNKNVSEFCHFFPCVQGVNTVLQRRSGKRIPLLRRTQSSNDIQLS
jgi:hypothetical protein